MGHFVMTALPQAWLLFSRQGNSRQYQLQLLTVLMLAGSLGLCSVLSQSGQHYWQQNLQQLPGADSWLSSAVAAAWLCVQQFSGLCAVLLLLLGAMTLELIARKLRRHQLQVPALCLASGMTRWQCLLTCLWLWLFPPLLSLLAAIGLTLLTESLLLTGLAPWLPGVQSGWHWPALWDLWRLCLLLLLLTQLPSWLNLQRALLPDVAAPQLPAHISGALRLLALVLLLCEAGDWPPALLLGGVLMLSLYLLLAGAVALLDAGVMLTRHSNSLLAMGFCLLRQRLAQTSVHIIAIGLSLIVLMVSTRLSTDVSTLLESLASAQDAALWGGNSSGPARQTQFSIVGQGLVLLFSVLMSGLNGMLFWLIILSVVAEDQRRIALLLRVGLSRRYCLQLISVTWLLTAGVPVLVGLFSSWFLTAQLSQHYLGLMQETVPVMVLEIALEMVLTVLGLAATAIWWCRQQLRVPIRQLFKAAGG